MPRKNVLVYVGISMYLYADALNPFDFSRPETTLNNNVVYHQCWNSNSMLVKSLYVDGQQHRQQLPFI